VLQEFISKARRKPRLGIDEGRIDKFLDFTADLQPQPFNHKLILQAAAHANGCAIFYSEHLQHGFFLDHLTIVNPF
jgi:hypothetical protein